MKLKTAESWVNNNTQEIIERGVEFLQFTPEDSGKLIGLAKEAVQELVGNNFDPDISLFKNTFWERYYKLLGNPQGPEPQLRICIENGEPVAVITSYEMVVMSPPQKESKEKAA